MPGRRPAPRAAPARPNYTSDELARQTANERSTREVCINCGAVTAIGSAPTSLYWYFSDQNQLHELMIDAAIEPDYLTRIECESVDALCIGISVLTGPMIRGAIEVATAVQNYTP